VKKARPSATIENKKARRNYEVLETLEAGIVLTGSEVKSLRAGRARLDDAHAVASGSGLALLNMQIDRYTHASVFNHEEKRTRQLLLHKKEILQLKSQIQEKRMTVVPLKCYFNDRGRVKLLLGVARGKKQADKREDEKKKDAGREIARALKDHNKRA